MLSSTCPVGGLFRNSHKVDLFMVLVLGSNYAANCKTTFIKVSFLYVSKVFEWALASQVGVLTGLFHCLGLESASLRPVRQGIIWPWRQ